MTRFHLPVLLRRSVGLGLFLTAFLSPCVSVAGENEGEPAETSAAKPTVVLLKVKLDASPLSADGIERALEAELGVAVEQTGTSADLELELTATRVTARAKAERGRTVERSVALPTNVDEQLQVITLLSENLLRDEAGALLAELEESDVPAKAQPPETAAEAAAAATVSAPEPAEAAEPKKPKEPPAPFFPVGLSFVRQLAVPGRKTDVAFSISVLDGQWHALQGLGIAALTLSSTAPSRGLSIAGLGHDTPAFDGLAIAGLYDSASDPKGHFRGLQIAGLHTRVMGKVEGLQIAGLMTLAEERLIGLQIAPFNMAGVAHAGVQIGVVNYAAEGGTQIGVVNVRKKGAGNQIGVLGFGPGTKMQMVSWIQGLNLGDEQDGVPEGPTANVGVRIESKYVTSSVHLGVGVESTDCPPEYPCGDTETLFIPGYTIGGRLPVSKVWSFELDFQHRFTSFNVPAYHPHFLAFRASAVARVHRMVALFVAAGPELVVPYPTQSWLKEHVSLGVQLF